MKPQARHEYVSRRPIAGMLMLSFISVVPTPVVAQGSTSPKPPKEVLEEYRAMDSNGERLTNDGWYGASKFFVKPARRPTNSAIAVVGGERVDSPNPWFKGGDNRVEISVICDAVGQIDSTGRFTFVVAPSLIDYRTGQPRMPEPGAQQMTGPHAPLIRSYTLVLTDTHWEFGPNREGPKEVRGPLAWRIETFAYQPWVNVEAAIRYLTRLRDESSSEIVKSNADKSIATLKSLGSKP